MIIKSSIAYIICLIDSNKIMNNKLFLSRAHSTTNNKINFTKS